MGTLNICGFETGDSTEAFATAGTFSIQGTTVRTGSYALQVNPATTGTGYFELRMYAATGAPGNINAATVYSRFYFRFGTAPASNDEEFFSDYDTGNVLKMALRLNSAGNIVVYDAAGTLLATGATVLSSGTWYRIEFKVGTGSPGAWEVKIDGVSEASGTSTMTANTRFVRLGKANNRNGQTVNFYYDDVALSDSAYPGAGQCTVLVPNANGNAQTWTIGAGSGSHYQVVDEIPPNSDTDYLLSTGSAGDAETEALIDTGTAGITGTINTVKALAVIKRDGAANGSVKQRLRSASTNTDTSGATSGSAYTNVGQLADTDPATSSAWTTSGVDGVETGLVENSANKTRMTATYLMVDYVPAASGWGGLLNTHRNQMIQGVL